MIDFRYHIVSLIAVFLALAVGIVLGAGPLRGSLAEQLRDQIEQLTQQKEDLRAELDDARTDTGRMENFIGAAADRLIDGSLADLDVAVVELPDADAAITTALIDRVEQAGGTIVGRLAIDQSWTDPDAADARESTATEITSLMLVPPASGTPAAEVLGAGLVQSLAEVDPFSPDSFTASAQDIYAALTGSELVAEVEAPAMPADVVLMIAPTAEQEDGDGATPEREVEIATITGMAGRPIVLAGADTAGQDLVTAVRTEADTAEAVSTVDSTARVSGQTLVPLALAATAYGAPVGHYGLSEDATSVLPPVVTPPKSDEADGGDQGEGTEGGGDGTDGSGGSEQATDAATDGVTDDAEGAQDTQTEEAAA